MMEKRVGVAIAFTSIGIAMLAALNLLFSPGYIWFYYAAYAALWWPLAVYFYPHRSPAGFALIGSVMTAVFLVIVNLQNTPGHPWFLYAVYPLLLWPAVVYFTRRGKHKGLSIAGSILTIAYLIAVNILTSPGHLWYFYACYPLLWWPVAVHLGRKAGTIAFAWIACIATIGYYAAANLLLSPGFPWAICPAFVVLWWPLSMAFARKRAWIGYSIAMSLLTILFLFALNIASSQGYLWAAYPAYAILWWPLTMIFAKCRAWTGYSVAGALLLTGGFVALNAYTSPGTVWAIYPVFAVLWWPMTMLSARKKAWLGYAFTGTALVSVFFIAVNWLTSPGTVWAIYPIFAALWWPLALSFARCRNWTGFAIAGAALFSVFIATVNSLTSPGTPWAVFPIFAVLWWPLSMFFFRHKKIKAAG